jgi:hypothetical protein
MLLGDREPQAGICYSCLNPPPPRRRPRKKPSTYVCQQCGVIKAHRVRGRPRTYCPPCSTSTARRRRQQARTWEREGPSPLITE